MQYSKYELCFIIFIFSFFTFFSYSNLKAAMTRNVTEWSEVDKLYKIHHYKDALKLVDRLYERAKKRSDYNQQIKALFYTARYLQQVEEEAKYKILNKLEKEVSLSKTPVKQLLNSVIAQQYYGYYQDNRWKIMKRKPSPLDYESDDLRKWSPRRLVEKIIKKYQLSLTDPEELLKVKLIEFADIIKEGNLDTGELRATLYDFLTYRALDFFQQSHTDLYRPEDQFLLNEEKYFSQATEFAKLKIIHHDSLSLEYNALKIYQDFLTNSLAKRRQKQRFYADLNRYEFVLKNYQGSLPGSFYLKAITDLATEFKELTLAGEAYLAKANFLASEGRKYQAGQKATNKYRYSLKEAAGFCRKIIKEYKQSFAADKAKSLLADLTKTEFEISLETVVPAKQDFPVLLTFKNSESLVFRLYRTTSLEDDRFSASKIRRNIEEGKFSLNSHISERRIYLPDQQDYQYHRKEVNFRGLEYGSYFYLIYDNEQDPEKGNLEIVSFTVSDLTLQEYRSNYPADADKLDFKVLNRRTGLPVADVSLYDWQRKFDNSRRTYYYEKFFLGKSDKKGEFSFRKAGKNMVAPLLEKGADLLLVGRGYYFNRSYNSRRDKKETIFFTDRSLYRPGQQIYFKGLQILSSGLTGEKKILPAENAEIILYDANQQEVSKLNLKTNDFGSFHSSFSLPVDLLNGQFNLYCRETNSRYYFSVEEYKRPKFELVLTAQEEEFKLGDIYTLAGSCQAYAGYPVENGKVSYKVTRQAYFPYRFFYYPFPVHQVQLKSGELKSDSSGDFKISFPLIPDPDIPKEFYPAFHYRIEVSVTDEGGETISAVKTISAGYKSLLLNLSVNTEFNKDLDSLRFFLAPVNLAGKEQSCAISYIFSKLKSPEKPILNRYGEEPDLGSDFNHPNYYLAENEYKPENLEIEKEIIKGKIEGEAEKSALLTNLNELSCGLYKLECHSVDKDGEEVKDEKIITIYSVKNEKYPDYQPFQVSLLGTNYYKPGDEAHFWIHSGFSTGEVTALINYKEKKEVKVLKLKEGNKKFKLKIPENDEQNIFVNFSYIKYNRVFTENLNLSLAKEDKNLKFEFLTFRDKTQPGTKEEWQVKVTDSHNNPILSELVASMYDSSLDQIKPHYWSANLGRIFNPFNSNIQIDRTFSQNRSNVIYQPDNYQSIKTRSFPKFNWYGYQPGGSFYGGRGGKSFRSDGMVMKQAFAAPAVSGLALEADESPTLAEREVSVPKLEPVSTKSENEVKVRTNFAETAFFYPELKTNKKGETLISFTAPEGLGRYKFMSFSHTKDLFYGQTARELTVSRDFMVIPQLPRFVYEGDEIILPVKLVSTRENTAGNLHGNVELVITDALTGKELTQKFIVANQKQKFSLQGKTTVKKFKIKIPENLDLLSLKVVANCGDQTDGEEHVLPVLKNRIFITETMPVWANGKETRSFDFTRLKQLIKDKDVDSEMVTFEYTANPVWNALTSLPYLLEYPYDCNEQIFNRFFAASLGRKIIIDNPEIEKVFKYWLSYDPKSLKSPLEKNQELKNVLLKETPWVRDGQDEEANRKRMAELFQENNLKQALNRAITKLKANQLPEGGWAWFKGMQVNRYITAYIVNGFARLDKLGAINLRKDRELLTILHKALLYLDGELTKDYEYLLNHDIDLSRKNLGYLQLKHLFLRVYLSKYYQVQAKNQKSYNYYLSQTQKYGHDFSLNGRGMSASVLDQTGHKEKAKEIMEGLKQQSLYSEEMGRFWKYTYSPSWYHNNIETHSLLIELFAEISNDLKTADELKLWLLKHRQTTSWKTTTATSAAVSSLLSHGTSWKQSGGKSLVVLGDQRLDKDFLLSKGVRETLGTGYYKVKFQDKELKQDLARVKIINKANNPVYGAIYYQYFTKLSKVSASKKNSLQLKKVMYKEVNTKSGPVLKEIKSAEDVSPGDKIVVKLEFSADRDYEYVHLHDLRPACLEPGNSLSGVDYQEKLFYYKSIQDTSVDYFIEYLPKGNYQFTYNLRATHQGNFTSGISRIQCLYAPEFTAHTEGGSFSVK